MVGLLKQSMLQHVAHCSTTQSTQPQSSQARLLALPGKHTSPSTHQWSHARHAHSPQCSCCISSPNNIISQAHSTLTHTQCLQSPPPAWTQVQRISNAPCSHKASKRTRLRCCCIQQQLPPPLQTTQPAASIICAGSCRTQKNQLANPHLPQSDSKQTILSIRWPASSINQSYSGPSPHPASCAARRALRFARLPEPGVLPADAP